MKDRLSGEVASILQWRSIQQVIDGCEACTDDQSALVGSPLSVGEIPDPPAQVEVLFVGVAPTSQGGRHRGRHFWSNVTDPLRLGLFSVLDGLLESQLRAINVRSKSAADDDFRARKFFFVHSSKARPVPAQLKAPPEAVIASCARRHLVEEIMALRPQAVCFLGHNTAPAAGLLGLAVDDRIMTTTLRSETFEWLGTGLATVQPVRGGERRASAAIRRLFLQIGLLEQS
jgi:uracil-DNA glycosylase